MRRAGRAGTAPSPLRPLRRERLSRGRARVPGWHRLRARGSGLRVAPGCGVHPPSGARSPAAAPAERARGALAFHPPPIVISSPAASPFAPTARRSQPRGLTPLCPRRGWRAPAGAVTLGQTGMLSRRFPERAASGPRATRPPLARRGIKRLRPRDVRVTGIRVVSAALLRTAGFSPHAGHFQGFLPEPSNQESERT